MNAFLAHIRSATMADLATPLAALRALARPDDRIILAREDYEALFKQLGSWWAWTTSIAERYDLVVVVPGPNGGTGGITAQIVQRALAHGKPVWQWGGGSSTFAPVRGIANVNTKDRKEGWRCQP